MAGKISAKGAVITLDNAAGSAQTISTDVESYEIEWAVGAEEVTGFGDGSGNFVPGLPVASITLNLFYDTTATTGAWTVVRAIIGHATSKTVSITPEAGLAFSGEFMCAGVNVVGDAKGSPAKLGAVKFMPMGAVAAAWA